MPDGITQALQSIQPVLQPALQVAQLGSTGYNLYNQYQNQQYQNTLRQDAQNPAKVTALAQQYTQPLNAGLTAAVNNQTQAQLAQAGLSESPQIAQTVEAQAIAPYIQQNQQQGYQNAIQALNLGGGAIPPALQQQNGLAALAKAFSTMGGTPPPGALPNAANIASAGANPLLNPNLWGSNPITAPTSVDMGAGYSPSGALPYSPPPDVTEGSFNPDYTAGFMSDYSG